MDRGARQGTIHGVAKSWTSLTNTHTHTHTHIHTHTGETKQRKVYFSKLRTPHGEILFYCCYLNCGAKT